MIQAGSRVLVVEDDSTTRALIVAVLEDGGFAVLDASSGREAVRLMIDPDHVGLVITNVDRPWPDGIAIARHARARNPAIPILFITNVTEKLRLANVPRPYWSLPKPFTRAGLAAAIDAIIRDIMA